jgi:hypothetical protein
MRWKISRRGQDPRQIDLMAALALLIIIVAAYQYFNHSPEAPSATAFIEPSQACGGEDLCLRRFQDERQACA